MKELNKNHVYSLEDLTSEERKELLEPLNLIGIKKANYLSFGEPFGWVLGTFHNKETVNAKELFYTLANVAVVVNDLTKEQKKNLESVFVSHKYFRKPYTENKELISYNGNYKYEITYSKFMELFAEPQYEVTEKPKHYSKGIDTFARMEANCTKEEVFNPQQHYFNEPKQFRSLFELSHILELNEWEFDVLKRLVRCRKKGQFKEDLKKIKDTVDIYLKEFTNETKS